ncbi:MAG: replication initiator protein [Arizlama microvirus]|nr:MAG: replication initiator protein [Arizlama microvirus]
MTCFSPLQGYESVILSAKGIPLFTYSLANARRVRGRVVVRFVKCRKCEGCRNDASREAATKIMCEAQIYDERQNDNCSFITLTYNDDLIPEYGTLDYVDHWTNFLKRLRRALDNIKIRFYMVGEYGTEKLRPHYHAIIFGFNFPDKEPYIDHLGNTLYRSKFLESRWTAPRGHERANHSFGYSSIGNVSFESAAYVARYSMKKVIGSEYDGYEEHVTDEGLILLRPKRHERYVRTTKDGTRISVERERALMSNGGGKGHSGGIGKSYFLKYKNDCYRKITSDVYIDCVNLLGDKKVKNPTYFDKLLDRVNPDLLESIRASRQQAMATHADEFTPERLAQRREYFLSKMKDKKRNIGKIYEG